MSRSCHASSICSRSARERGRVRRGLRGGVGGSVRVRWGSVRARGGLPPRCGGCGERRERRGGGGRGVRRERRSVFVVFVVFVGVVRVSGFAVADAVGGTRLGERAREGVGGEEERFVRSHGVSSELVDRVAFVASARAEERVPAGAASRHPGEQKTSPHPRARAHGSAGDGVAWRRQRERRFGRRTRERSCRGLSAAAMSSRRVARPEASARWCATEIARGRETVRAHARKRARFASACVAASGRSARKVSPFFTGASATSARPRPSIDTHATRGGEGPSLRARPTARVRAIESSSAAAVRATLRIPPRGLIPRAVSPRALRARGGHRRRRPDVSRARRETRAHAPPAPHDPSPRARASVNNELNYDETLRARRAVRVRFLSAYDRRRSRGTRHVLVSSHPKRARVTDLPSIPLTRSSRPVRPA